MGASDDMRAAIDALPGKYWGVQKKVSDSRGLDLTEIKARLPGAIKGDWSDEDTRDDVDYVVGQVPALLARVEELEGALFGVLEQLEKYTVSGSSEQHLGLVRTRAYWDEIKKALGLEAGEA